ncbi:helix-turn-helix transcriptional regulator [Streptomyces sp. VRA16 Mangrove soil]|uniref:helix-turn-helix domain-containing protein n=1 Tax=Streptomyces sp. VRA16 Mangrove soil TaxID=2817434 RepID=UPI001A9D34BC|nr:helix-turn-helix transcriptional regulator [Streptomyces sp. VRA16 Mangrove soil]MBO1329936.1 helix-turn-helix transcriptional regulator [Streptomyces sp. VRA16 Mangrove soil]
MPGPPSPASTPPPFDAVAARRIRESLGMAPGHVAHGLRASYGMGHITPDTVTAWERGLAAPSPPELTALAAVLWCEPTQLIGTPRGLREHRLVRGYAAADVARTIGMDVATYETAERTGVWSGDARQSAALASVLGLTPRDRLTVMGHDARLAELLGEAVATRWQAHSRAIAKLIGIERRALEEPLRTMHQEYQRLMAATLSRAGGAAASGEQGRIYLERILDHFWSRMPDR